MSFFLVRSRGVDEDEFILSVRDKITAPWSSYADMTRSFLKVRVEKIGWYWFFEFVPAIPPLHFYLFGVTALLLLFGLWGVALVPLLLGLFIGAWYFPQPYMLLLFLGFKKRFGRWPDFDFHGSRYVVRDLAGAV